jgi:hypothetical protein
MKKFFSIIALSAMTLSLSSFTTLNNESNNLEITNNCVQLAMEVHDSWTNQGFSDHYASGWADQAYDACMAHIGGHMQ